MTHLVGPQSCRQSNLRAFLLSGSFLLLTAATAAGVTFTTDTLIDAGDTTYYGEDIVVNGCTLTVNGQHAFNSLQVINSGAVTHSAYSDDPEHKIDLNIAQDVTIDATSHINADGKGHGPESGLGAGSGGFGGGGAGYGGRGGNNEEDTGGGTTYGSITEPVDLGSGGGTSTAYPGADGGAGGGVIRLTVVGTLSVDGMLTADGGDGSTEGYYGTGGGGGSGGSIYLTVGTLVHCHL